MNDMDDILSDVLADSEFCSGPEMAAHVYTGVSKAWLTRPYLSALKYLSGFGELPVVWRSEEALESDRYRWFVTYHAISVIGWPAFSIIGSLAGLSPDLDKVRRLSGWLRLRVPATYVKGPPSKIFAIWACYFWTAACAPVLVTNWYRFTHFVLGSFIVGLVVFALNLFHSDEKGHPIVGFFLVSLAALLLRLCLWGLHVL